MSQRELLLLILTTLVVSIALAIFMNVLEQSKKTANLDSVKTDIGTLAVMAQSYYHKKEEMGGGGNSFGGLKFTYVPFPADSISKGGQRAINANGLFIINQAGGSNTFRVIAHPASRIAGDITFKSQATVDGGQLVADIAVDDIQYIDPN